MLMAALIYEYQETLRVFGIINKKMANHAHLNRLAVSAVNLYHTGWHHTGKTV